jgi:hypothetical protein
MQITTRGRNCRGRACFAPQVGFRRGRWRESNGRDATSAVKPCVDPSFGRHDEYREQHGNDAGGAAKGPQSRPTAGPSQEPLAAGLQAAEVPS